MSLENDVKRVMEEERDEAFARIEQSERHPDMTDAMRLTIIIGGLTTGLERALALIARKIENP